LRNAKKIAEALEQFRERGGVGQNDRLLIREAAAYLRALPDPPLAGGDEFAWLIECANPPLYWIGHGLEAEHFTPNHEGAVRFARFEDAEVVRCWLLKGGVYCKSVRHGWTKVPLPPPPALAVDGGEK
jgi:hypothetical protein